MSGKPTPVHLWVDGDNRYWYVAFFGPDDNCSDLLDEATSPEEAEAAVRKEFPNAVIEWVRE